jgi:uncharacterized protein (DUF885 family)
MKIKINITLILFLLITSLSIQGQNYKSFKKISINIHTTLNSFYPVNATYIGIHTYDGTLADFSEKSVKAVIKKLTDYEKALFKYKSANLSKHDRINYKLLKSNVDIALLDLKQIKWHKKSPQLYVNEAVDGLYLLLLSKHASLADKLDDIISRMNSVKQLMYTAQINIKSPPPLYIELVDESLESGISFYRDVAGELMKQFPERADEILKASTLAREAMNDFLIYLTEIKPGSEKSFAIGKNNYDYKLKHEYFLNYDADSLLKIGQALYKEANKNYKDYEKLISSKQEPKNEQSFVPQSVNRQDVLDYYNWEINQVKLFLEKSEIVSLPKKLAPVTAIETPPFLRSMIGGIAYQPAGAFDSNPIGYFYVRPLPEEFSDENRKYYFDYIQNRKFKGSVVHEAFPGHHLQMQLAAQNTDPIRKWQQNMMMVEGWALYSEQMMYENGLYGRENQSQWLAILDGIRFRAARIIADVKLHTGKFSYNECVGWMIKALELTKDSQIAYIKKEVRKMTVSPTNRINYLIGKVEILKLRDAYQMKMGDSFNLKDFHDVLLAEGSIPPVLMWDILELN